MQRLDLRLFIVDITYRWMKYTRISIHTFADENENNKKKTSLENITNHLQTVNIIVYYFIAFRTPHN